MIKKLQKFLIILLTILITIYPEITSLASPITNDIAYIVQDSSLNEIIPDNFRKTSNLEILKNYNNLNLYGLDKLNISGSDQFSKYNIKNLIKEIGTDLDIVNVDLRQESHGFINGIAISFANKFNNANAGLSRNQVMIRENAQLLSIPLNTPLTLDGRHPKTITPFFIEDENLLSSKNSLEYIRIPVTDGKIPTDDMVDYFVSLVSSKFKDKWIHFHCKRGIGRTTTFMIMYDMMKNSNKVSYDDIVNRQLFLANFKETTMNSFKNDTTRTNFLKNFYNYSKENSNSYSKSWSEWIKK